jgi:multidrug efflux pump subunit AcrA (membrane-fusion protein)
MNAPFFRSAICALLLVMAASCRRTEGGAASTSGPAPVPWRWEDFPAAGELLLAQLPALVQPAQTAIVRAPAAGELVLLPASSSATLANGTAWARIDATGAANDEHDIAQLRSRLAERRDHYSRFELPTMLARLDREIADAEETLAVSRFAEKSPELFRGDDPSLDPQLRPTLTPAQAEAQVQRLREERQRLAAGDRAAEPADLVTLQAQLEQRERARQLRDEQLTLTTPFAGRLRLAMAQTPRHVEAGEIIATFSDASSLEVRVRATLPLLHSVPSETLRALVALPGGDAASAGFVGSTVESQPSGLVSVFRFRVAASSAAAQALPAAGVELPVLVFTRLAHEARIVPKLTLVERDTAGVLRDGWRAGLPRLLPGTELLAEGRQALALQPPR